MPELPEVQTVVNSIRDDLIGEEIIDIDPIWENVLFNFNRSVFNKSGTDFKVIDVRRRAKLIIIQTRKYILAVHLRMTGKLYFLQKKNYPKHTRAIIYLKNNKKLVFEDTRKFGRIYLYDDMNFINSRHGVEPLGKKFSKKFLSDLLISKRRNIKYLLLDQKFIAGLGNIYVDESLWMSKIHPKSISNRIPKRRVHNLFESIKIVLLESLESMGTTIINYSYVNGKSGNYSEQLRVFGRTGRKCLRCQSEIEKIKVAGRGTHFCRKCQKQFS